MATMNRLPRWQDYSGSLLSKPNRTRTMTISAQNATNKLAFPHALLAAALAAALVSSPAEARAPGGAYDGIWNVVFATTRGTCSSGYNVPFTVTGGRVSSAGGGRVEGRVSRVGSVAVRVRVGASQASGGGRLVGNFGSGAWSGIISGDRCSGTWRASRT
jgi:hypothetical protein